MTRLIELLRMSRGDEVTVEVTDNDTTGLITAQIIATKEVDRLGKEIVFEPALIASLENKEDWPENAKEGTEITFQCLKVNTAGRLALFIDKVVS